MPKFVVGNEDQNLHVTLVQDRKNVNIVINGILVAFLCGEDGYLQLCDLKGCKGELPGVTSTDEVGKSTIVVRKW